MKPRFGSRRPVMLSENWIDLDGPSLEFETKLKVYNTMCFVFIVVYMWDRGHLPETYEKVESISLAVSTSDIGYPVANVREYRAPGTLVLVKMEWSCMWLGLRTIGSLSSYYTMKWLKEKDQCNGRNWDIKIAWRTHWRRPASFKMNGKTLR